MRNRNVERLAVARGDADAVEDENGDIKPADDLPDEEK
jgi:hypothetical protein